MFPFLEFMPLKQRIWWGVVTIFKIVLVDITTGLVW